MAQKRNKEAESQIGGDPVYETDPTLVGFDFMITYSVLLTRESLPKLVPPQSQVKQKTYIGKI